MYPKDFCSTFFPLKSWSVILFLPGSSCHIRGNELKDKIILFFYGRLLLRLSLRVSKEYKHIFIQLRRNSCSGDFNFTKENPQSNNFETLAQTEAEFCICPSDKVIKSCSVVDTDLSHRPSLTATGQKSVEFYITRGVNCARTYPCACPYNSPKLNMSKSCPGLSEPWQPLRFAINCNKLNFCHAQWKRKTTCFAHLVQLWWVMRRCT